MRIFPPLLLEPYPVPKANRRSFFIALGFGCFIAAFLYYFEPFDISIRKDSAYYLAGFGMITFIVLLIFLIGLPLRFPGLFRESGWTVLHQLGFIFFILLTIATANGIYTNYLNSLAFSWNNYLWIINRTFVLGFIPFSFLTMMDYIRRKNNAEEMADILTDDIKKPLIAEAQQQWEISTAVQSERLIIDRETFYFAQAAGNYTDVFRYQDQILHRSTYRINLSHLENQLHASYFVRCHNSYLVNLEKVAHVTGNAQGLSLHLHQTDQRIPVSRKFVSLIRKILTDR